MVLLARIELATSPLPRECSTTELQQLRFALFSSFSFKMMQQKNLSFCIFFIWLANQGEIVQQLDETFIPNPKFSSINIIFVFYVNSSKRILNSIKEPSWFEMKTPV